MGFVKALLVVCYVLVCFPTARQAFWQHRTFPWLWQFVGKSDLDRRRCATWGYLERATGLLAGDERSCGSCKFDSRFAGRAPRPCTVDPGIRRSANGFVPRATSSDPPNLTLLVLLETVRWSPVFSDSILELGTPIFTSCGYRPDIDRRLAKRGEADYPNTLGSITTARCLEIE